ncbi:MAG: KUP/HAK/KT family potassium transporter, partial [Candidatus Roizmanbacteria bacterium]|nr:KUP/HAK/KT family potassium transporter [Candidatus Roizmanbacteria bacterium]
MKGLLGMSLAALGVVYGDIGTSPLYAVNEIFFGRARESLVHGDILGIISIIFWILTLIVTIKYISIVLNADSEGEGGVFSLYSLIQNSKVNNTYTKLLIVLFIIASGLLLGDGIITPAISVVSAVEGLKVITSTFDAYIVPITIVILTGLFLIQS